MCSLEKRGTVFVLTLLGGGEHRLSPDYIDSIISALAHVNERSQEASALITTNEGKFFSNGLDLDWVNSNSSPLHDKEARFRHLSCKFRELLAAFLNLKMPSIAAVRGHAVAGGFILALAHDYRFMRKDRGFMYMSEVDVDIVIPSDVMSIIRSKINPSVLTEVVLGGRKYTAEMGLKEGFVDSAHNNSAETLDAAISAAEQFGRRAWNKDVYLALRHATFPQVVDEFELLGYRPLPSRL
eukprot:Gb_12044 [translate_table: standard]